MTHAPDAAARHDGAAWSAAIARGDEAAYAAFYRAWFPAALALARAACRRDEAFCLDVVQDVMVRVARKLPALRDDRAVRAWMGSAVLHAAQDRLRAERRRMLREQTAQTERAADVAAEPFEGVLATERAQWLAARVAELPASDQALLAARFSDGDSVAAAGARWQLGADQAHGRLRRVMQRLRRLAAEWWQ